MIHYNSNNNAYCRAVNAETFQTIEHNPVWISILLYTRNPYFYSHFEIVICIYSVRGKGWHWPNVNKYIQLYHLQCTKCLHFCLHIDWNLYSTFKVLNSWKLTSYCSLEPLMVGHGGSSAGSYLADPTSPIPSHCASIAATSTVRVKSICTVLITKVQYKGE